MIDPPQTPESRLTTPAADSPRQPVSALELIHRAQANLAAKSASGNAPMLRPPFVNGPQALLDECREVADTLRSVDWATLSPAQRRASGLIAKWAIERALEAAHQELGRPLPADRSLDALARSAGIAMTTATEILLLCISDDVTAVETRDDDPLPTHEDACTHARGVIFCIIQSLVLHRTST